MTLIADEDDMAAGLVEEVRRLRASLKEREAELAEAEGRLIGTRVALQEREAEVTKARAEALEWERRDNEHGEQVRAALGRYDTSDKPIVTIRSVVERLDRAESLLKTAEAVVEAAHGILGRWQTGEAADKAYDDARAAYDAAKGEKP